VLLESRLKYLFRAKITVDDGPIREAAEGMNPNSTIGGLYGDLKRE